MVVNFVPLSGNSIELYVEAKYAPLSGLQRKVLQQLLSYSFDQKCCFTPSAIHYLFDAVNKETKLSGLEDSAVLRRLDSLLGYCDRRTNAKHTVSRKRITRVLTGHSTERPWV